MRIPPVLLVVALLLSLNPPDSYPVTITQIIDAAGDSLGNALDYPRFAAADRDRNVFVTGSQSDNVFKIEPDGTITEIIDVTGNGLGDSLMWPDEVAVDTLGNVYVIGLDSQNAFKITPAGVITEIIDATASPAPGDTLIEPGAIAVDDSLNVYVSCNQSFRVYKIAASGTITTIMDVTGDGVHAMGGPEGLAVDDSFNVYVAAHASENAFKITPLGLKFQIIDSNGSLSPADSLECPRHIAVDREYNVYVTGVCSDNAFKITKHGVITEIIDETGDGIDPFGYDVPSGICVDDDLNVYTTGYLSGNAFQINDGGGIKEIMDNNGDGKGNTLLGPVGVAVDIDGTVYVVGQDSHNAFRVIVYLTECGDCDYATLVRAERTFRNACLNAVVSDGLEFVVLPNEFWVTTDGGKFRRGNPFLDGSCNIASDNQRIHVALSDGTVLVTDSVTVEATMCLSEKNEMRWTEVYFTVQGTRHCQVPSSSFKIASPVDTGGGFFDHVVTIQNDTDLDASPISLQLRNVEAIADFAFIGDLGSVVFSGPTHQVLVGSTPITVGGGASASLPFTTFGSFVGGHVYLRYEISNVSVPSGPNDWDAVLIDHPVVSTATGVAARSRPAGDLEQSYPNPFNPTTTIGFSVENRTLTTLKIYDVNGRLVRTLIDDVLEPRAEGYRVVWDGRNDADTPAASGVYFCRLVTEGFAQTRKMVLLK